MCNFGFLKFLLVTIKRMIYTNLIPSKLSAAFTLVLILAVSVGCTMTPSHPPTVMVMDQTSRGVELKLNDKLLLFEFGKANLDASAATYLDKIAALIIYKSSKPLLVGGFTDNIGTMEVNQTLSDERARVVSHALQKRGVPAGRLRTEGYALHRPVMPNSSEEGRALNRRVEIVVLDETIDNLTSRKPENAFELAFLKLKYMVDQGTIKAL